MHRILKIPAIRFVMSIAFLLGLTFIFLSLWLKPYMDAQQAFEQESYEESLEDFDRAAQRFEGLGVAKLFMPEVYSATLTNQFYILYQLGDYDALLEKSASSPVMAPIHYWTGCALFRRASEFNEPQDQIAWLQRASEEFLSVLKFEPGNWDAKYNYELTNRLIDSLKNDDESPPQVLEILRPRPRQGEQSFRQTG